MQEVDKQVIPRRPADGQRKNLPLHPDHLLGKTEFHARELRRIGRLAQIFLAASGGDTEKAVKILDETIDALLDCNVLSMWRYRLFLAAIRGEAK